MGGNRELECILFSVAARLLQCNSRYMLVIAIVDTRCGRLCALILLVTMIIDTFIASPLVCTTTGIVLFL